MPGCPAQMPLGAAPSTGLTQLGFSTKIQFAGDATWRADQIRLLERLPRDTSHVRMGVNPMFWADPAQAG
jgi:hypothetical protein